jgi:hypothetical protein
MDQNFSVRREQRGKQSVTRLGRCDQTTRVTATTQLPMTTSENGTQWLAAARTAVTSRTVIAAC